MNEVDAEDAKGVLAVTKIPETWPGTVAEALPLLPPVLRELSALRSSAQNKRAGVIDVPAGENGEEFAKGFTHTGDTAGRKPCAPLSAPPCFGRVGSVEREGNGGKNDGRETGCERVGAAARTP